MEFNGTEHNPEHFKVSVEKPILCSTQVVRNILENRQTQDRRPVKPQPPDNPTSVSGKRWGMVDGNFYYCGIKSPYSVGDLLYCREKLYVHKEDRSFFYAADGFNPGPPEYKTIPSIHMLKKYARLWLEVTGVRMERVQEISEEDALAEGVIPQYAVDCIKAGHSYTAIPLFKTLWQSLYPGSWGRNDWVWVYDFRRIER